MKNKNFRIFIYFFVNWFNKDWWMYLLAKPKNPSYCNWWTRFWCRVKGHPCGPWYYSSSYSEPNMKCKNCGDCID